VSTPRPLLLLDEVASTQDVALAIARDGAQHGTAVVAEVQSAGRGRRGGRWLDAPGRSLLHSRILRPERPLAELPTLSLVAGIAIAEAAGALGAAARLKWPNDVLVDGRKLAGILAEWHAPEHVVICGIGINVRPLPAVVDVASFGGSELAPTSLRECGVEVDRLTVLRLVLDRFDEVYAIWASAGFEPLVERYAALDALTGVEVEGDGAGAPLRGVARGVDASGARVVEAAGERRLLVSGAVRRLRLAGPRTPLR
jgi:BirA family biotin operon repressor/biotin-[acetyl-CoA-carboxylase] ligase